jgi:hypothetical protein
METQETLARIKRRFVCFSPKVHMEKNGFHDKLKFCEAAIKPPIAASQKIKTHVPQGL